MNNVGCLEKMNPKVKMIVEETFPRIVERHVRTRVAIESTERSLDSYRKMGHDAIRNLPPGERELNEKALDSAYNASGQQVHDFHAREKAAGLLEGTGEETT